MTKLLPFLPVVLLFAGCSQSATTPPPGPSSSGAAANSAPETSGDTNSGLAGQFEEPLPKGSKMPSATLPARPRSEGDRVLIKQLAPDRSADWQTTTMAVTQLASEVGKAMATVKDTKGTIYVVVETPLGRGFLNQELKIKDNKHYNINYVVLEDRPKHSMVTANGRQKQEQIDGKWQPAVSLAKPLPDASVPADKLASRWALDFTRTMWLGLTDSRDSWPAVVSQWLTGTGEYEITTQERHINYQGHDMVDYRIEADRKPAARPKLGSSTVQIVIDAQRHLPVTIVSDNTDSAGKNWKMTWTCHYDFQQKFGPKDF